MIRAERQGDWFGLQGHQAGLVSRGVASVIDAVVVVFVLGSLVLLGIGTLRYLFLGPPFSTPDLSPRFTTLFGAGIAVIYLTWSWVTAGRTAGDQVMGLRVTSRSGQRLGPARALLRAVLCVAFPVGLLWIPLSRHNASLQDIVVRSVVVYDWHYRPAITPHPRPASPKTDATYRRRGRTGSRGSSPR